MFDLPPFHTFTNAMDHSWEQGWCNLPLNLAPRSPALGWVQQRGDWPSGSWVSCVGWFQAWEVLKPRRMGLGSPWELTLPQPLLNPLQKGRMIPPKFFLCLTHALCVHMVYLYHDQSEISVKACQWKYTMCSFSSKYYFYLLPDMPLTISYSRTRGIWLFEGNRWVWAFWGW